MKYESLFADDKHFLEIASHYYNKNFGSMSKSELDLLMFKIFYDGLKNKNDDSSLTDVALAIELGITKQKVKSLKERMFLKYSSDSDFDWKREMRDCISKPSVEYDDTTGKFTILVSDSRFGYAVEDFLETNRLISDYSHNSKLLVLSRRAFVFLAYESCDDAEKRRRLEDCFTKTLNEERKQIEGQLKAKTFWTRCSNALTSNVMNTVLDIIGLGLSVVR